MSVKIITGSVGSGKTRYCIDEIERVHSEDPNRHCIMLVPTHYTHETEAMLINKFGGTGLNNIECTSLEKLSRELISGKFRRLGASGKNALVCRAVSLALKEAENTPESFDRRLLRAVGKNGFVDVAASLISEMHRYNAEPQTLADYSQNTKNPLLSQKLKLLSLISENYNTLLFNTDCVDCDDDLSRLAPVMSNNFNSSHSVWIDKFDEFLPQQFEVISALIESGAEVTVTFSVCKNNEDTYFGTKKAISDLTNLYNAQIIHLGGEMKHIKSPDLKFLFTNWFEKNVYNKDCENIELFASRDAYTETEHIAAKILDLVREDGYRFFDIGILCGTKNGYSHIIESVFDEYEIPYYTDERISVSEYPIAMQILSLFDIIEHNWDSNSMFEYMRAGFIYTKERTNGGKVKYKRLNTDDIDLLENHVLRYGIEYKNAWCRSTLEENRSIIDTAFEQQAKASYNAEKLDNVRKNVVTPILNYTEAIKTAKTVSDYCRVLFAFLEDINLYQGLKTELLSMAVNNATADAQRFGQLWNLLLDVLDQLDTALGNTEVTHEEFAQYVKAALNKCMIRTVPSGTDRVFIGSADMNRAIPTPIVFVMGAVAGTFPQISTSEGFLSNSDRTALLDDGLRLAPTTLKKAEKESNTVYKLFSAATEKLFISYPTMTAEGASNLPSQVLSDIRDILPDLRICDDLTDNGDDFIRISSPKATLHKFLINPNANPLWEHVNAWFDLHDEWKNKLFTVNNAKYKLSSRKIELSESTAKQLYDGNIRYSATRLNSYASCPFSHYMQYGLHAKEREIYDIKPTDTGTYAHEIIRRFCTAVDSDECLDWHNITDVECTDIVSEIVGETIKKINDSELRDKEMTADILRRMGKTVTEAAKTVCKSIKCSDFQTESYEREIYIKLNENIELGGIIDRLDVCRLDDRNEYRIIDYKTGNKDFSAADVYYGLDMQPVIYALAMRMLDNKAVVSGMYYSMMHNDFAAVDMTSGDKKINTELKKNTAYNGVTFVGNNKNEPIPEDEINRIETELSRSEGALFFTGRADKFGYTKSVRSRPEGEWLTERVRNNIINADKNIRGGDIALSPLSHGSKNACTYCAYSSVCRFDADAKNERVITESDSEIWKMSEEDK